LWDIQEADYPCFRHREAAGSGNRTMWINARLVPSRANFETLRALRDRDESGIVHSGSAVAVAILPRTAPPPPEPLNFAALQAYFQDLGLTELDRLDAELPLLEYPHDIVRYNQDTLEDNLRHRLAVGDHRQLADGLFAAEGVRLGEHLVIDTRRGPIVLENDVRIGPFTYLCGPIHLAARTRVIEHAAIKDHVSIGHTAKIGGEVEASVIESYTNKQHHGFLGHSYLGSWINLGAGTCNSDLKNTYGEVKMEYQGRRVSTGLQFLGCIMGDYAKSAINTGIFTGKTIGVCSMLYGFVTTNVPSFVNYARLFGQVTELPPDVMIATQRRMFARRHVTARPCDQQLIRDMYMLTRDERQLGGDPLLL
jgi:UDP-N-acetylglucosamine diphosphorylase / glucose-1-phosphate thymidylyltransferase / UDP-N-acetylgalactosamine diphosphorylase / glucosamine-1-phosphate N-acetyltransferase / galactosamine-1-phosphate N-acetyltransferase